MAVSEVYKKQFPKMVEIMGWDELKQKIEFVEYQLIIMKQEMERRNVEEKEPMRVIFGFDWKWFTFILNDILFPITNLEKRMKKENNFISPFSLSHYHQLRFHQIISWLLFPLTIVISIIDSTQLNLSWRRNL